jgi:hypothetical protein
VSGLDVAAAGLGAATGRSLAAWAARRAILPAPAGAACRVSGLDVAAAGLAAALGSPSARASDALERVVTRRAAPEPWYWERTGADAAALRLAAWARALGDAVLAA